MSDATTHRIQLRGPWEYTLVDGPRAGEHGRLDFSRDWHAQLPSGTQCIRLSRYFQTPTGLDNQTRVTVVLSDFPPATIVLLDGQPLPHSTAQRFDITTLLHARHRLELELMASELLTSGEVRLEICEGSL